MILICPECGCRASATAWDNDPVIRELFVIVVKLPKPVQVTLFGYLSLFRPQTRSLSWKRSLTETKKLAALVALGHIHQQNKIDRVATATHWAEAMDRMVAYPPKSLPLRNHNYLRAIVHDIAEGADQQTEQATRTNEQHGHTVHRPASYQTTPGDGMSQVMRDYMAKHGDPLEKNKMENCE